MESVDYIEAIYESMCINNSIVVCDSPSEMAFMIDSLESKSFPCRYVSCSSKDSLRESPNNMFVCMEQEFNTSDFWENLTEIEIDCVFFIGQNVFQNCLSSLNCHENLSSKRQFIFTL